MATGLNAAISGLGLAGLRRSQPLGAGALALQAMAGAMDDAGLKHGDIDGLLISNSSVSHDQDVNLRLQRAAGLRDLRLLQFIDGEGTSALQMLHTAALAVSAGMANHVVCVFADAPLRGGKSGAQAFGGVKSLSGMAGLRYSSGLFGAPAIYAMAARRHMARYGTTVEHFGAVALAARAWAGLNPAAVFREPLTMEAYLASRMIAEPFRLLDCATPVDGAIAVIVSATKRAADLRQPPVHILGLGQGHPASPRQRPFDSETVSGAPMAKATAFGMAGITEKDVDMLQLYDAFTYMSLLALEEYGFCAKGEAGPFFAAGHTGPAGSLPVNTGGGQLSGYYLQGMTPLSEAIVQLRGQGGARQCARHDIALVTNEGGHFEFHACAVLGAAHVR